MATAASENDLPSIIQQLLEQKRLHLDSVDKIDHTLSRVSAALRGATVPTASKPAAAPKSRPNASPAKKSKRSRYDVSASDLVLAFVKENGSPTTQAIMQHLVKEGARSVPAATPCPPWRRQRN